MRLASLYRVFVCTFERGAYLRTHAKLILYLKNKSSLPQRYSSLFTIIYIGKYNYYYFIYDTQKRLVKNIIFLTSALSHPSVGVPPPTVRSGRSESFFRTCPISIATHAQA